MSNPYLKNFSKAFNVGLAVVLFVGLIVISACQSAYAQTYQATMNVICSDIQQLNKEIQGGSLKILSFNEAEMIGDSGGKLKVDKFLVQFPDGNVGTFLIDSSGTTCLIFRDIAAKVSSN